MGTTIRQLRERFFADCPWVDPLTTCDQIVRGDPNREIRRVGVGWMPCADNLAAAGRDGCDLFISHETFFCGHWAPGLDSPDTRWAKRRLAILEEYDLACMNLHDTWDNFPHVGIRDSWREFLGLTELVAERPYYYPWLKTFTPRNSLALCRVRPQRLGDFAAFVANKCSRFRSAAGVALFGDPDVSIATVATGVGCHIPTLEMLDLGADVLVLTLDRAFQTTIRIPLAEMGANLIAPEHGTSEMPGMQSLAAYIERTFSGVAATFYCREPAARLFAG